MNIVLVGMMGSGKSSVGRILAQRLGRPFVDTDAKIVVLAGCSIPEIFAAEGEDGFRRREAEAVAAVAAQDDLVIATGGGAVLNPVNRDALRRTGLVFWLDASAEELLRRAQRQGLQNRPLLAEAQPLEQIQALSESRREAYQAVAHYRIETEGQTLIAVAESILDKVRESGR